MASEAVLRAAEDTRILLTAATLVRHTTMTKDFSVACMHTPVTEAHEILVEAPPDYGADGMHGVEAEDVTVWTARGGGGLSGVFRWSRGRT